MEESAEKVQFKKMRGLRPLRHFVLGRRPPSAAAFTGPKDPHEPKKVRGLPFVRSCLSPKSAVLKRCEKAAG